ncbi:MAG: alcohol dehydrogenase catalytic domain-containing protein [Paracoccaceae bacterium]
MIDPNLECGECDACKRGWAHLCEHLRAYGVSTNGGFAEFSAVRADRVHRIGDMPFETAASRRADGLRPQWPLALEGRTRRARGGVRMWPNRAVDGSRAQGAWGARGHHGRSRPGAARPGARPGALRAFCRAATSFAALTRKCDLAVDATGVPAVAGSLVDYVANGGAVSFFGVCPQDARIEISPFELFRREPRCSAPTASITTSPKRSPCCGRSG